MKARVTSSFVVLCVISSCFAPAHAWTAANNRDWAESTRPYRERKQLAIATDSIETARAAVQENMQTPEGRRYDDQVAREFGERYAGTMQKCASSADKLEDFEIFMRIARDGAVQEVITEPGAGIAACVRQQLANDSFAPPPRASYWVNISMKIEN